MRTTRQATAGGQAGNTSGGGAATSGTAAEPEQRQVTLTVAVVDEMHRLLSDLIEAVQPIDLPKVERRDPTLWHRVLAEARAEAAAAGEKRRAAWTFRPVVRPAPADSEKAEAMRRRGEERLVEIAEGKYRRADPSIRAEMEKRAATAASISKKLTELFRWHAPALNAELSWGGKQARAMWWAVAASMRPDQQSLRQLVLDALGEIRFRLERREDALKASLSAQGGPPPEPGAREALAPAPPPGGGQGDGAKADAREVAPLSEIDALILKKLAEYKHAVRCVDLPDWHRSTVAAGFKRLCARGFASWPKRSRKGACITEAGRAYLTDTTPT